MSLDCYSKVNLLPDNSGWVTSLENDALKDILFGLGVDCISKRITLCQTVYFPDKYSAIKNSSAYRILGNKLAFDYYHGDPFITPEFLPLLKRLKKSKSHFDRIRVSHSGIEDLLSNEGLHDKVFRIPIGIDSNLFSPQTPKSKSEIRSKLGIPQSSFVIGSFQKDGNGWGEGFTPKLIKGPDVFLSTLKIAKNHMSEIFVLLTGPSRGYVINGLEKLGVPYKHVYLDNYQDICQYYHALDSYLITSREEGGPKAVLESMASGIPLVSTRVGQAQDLILHDENGWISRVGDAEDLAHNIIGIYNRMDSIRPVVENGLDTAKQHSYNNQTELWRSFFDPILPNILL